MYDTLFAVIEQCLFLRMKQTNVSVVYVVPLKLQQKKKKRQKYSKKFSVTFGSLIRVRKRRSIVVCIVAHNESLRI